MNNKIAKLLTKHLANCKHGDPTNMARAIGTGRQRIYDWANGKNLPRAAMQDNILEYLKSRKEPKNTAQ